MATTYTRIAVDGNVITNTTGEDFYTAAASTIVVIEHLLAVNYTATAATLKLWRTPSGGSARQDADIIWNDINIPPYTSIDLCAIIGSITLEAGDLIHALAGTATAITLSASGLKETTS